MKSLAFLVALLATTGLYAQETPVVPLMPGTETEASATLSDYKKVESSIKEVIVFPTQARVTRHGSFKIPAGESRFAFYKLPEALRPDALAAELAKGAGVQIVSVQHHIDYTKDERTEAFEAATRAYKNALNALNQIDGRMARIREGIDAAMSLSPRRPEGAKTSPAPMNFSFDISNLLLKTAVAEITRLQAEQRALTAKRVDAVYAYRKAREVYDKTRAKVNSDHLAVITFRAEKATDVDVSLSYMIYGAQWSPAYDVRVSPDNGGVTLSSYGILRQQTGEDWRNVPIIFSTANPDVSADLPELRGQLIAERFVPAESKFASAKNFSYMRNEAVAKAEIDASAAKSESVVRALSTTTYYSAAPSVGSHDYKRDVGSLSYGEAYDAIEPALSVKAGGRSSRPTPPKPAKQSEAVQTTQSMAIQSQMINTASTLFTNSIVMGDGSTLNDCKIIETFRDEVSVRTAEGELREIPMSKIKQISSRMIEGRGLDISPSRLISPIRSAGGFDYRYPAARMENIPSDNQYRRILLKSSPLSGECYYNLIPALSEHAYLMCKTKNTLGAPVLPGPANLFYGSDYTGDIDFPRLDENAEYDLGLGVDQRIKTERKVFKHSETIGVISKARQTKINEEITITNDIPGKVKIQLDESLPVSNTDRIVIHEIKYSQTPSDDASVKDYKGPLPQGWRRWNLSLDTGKKSTVKIDYTIEYPTDYIILHGINDPNPSQPGFGPSIDNASAR